jgi:hypothetical protein
LTYVGAGALLTATGAAASARPADVTVIEGDSYRVRESEQESAARRKKK